MYARTILLRTPIVKLIHTLIHYFLFDGLIVVILGIALATYFLRIAITTNIERRSFGKTFAIIAGQSINYQHLILYIIQE